ncbi:MAG: VWA domain-containing protein [Vicinamibacterales bacterium]
MQTVSPAGWRFIGSISRASALGVLICLAPSPEVALSAQNQRPEFRAGTTLVPIEVRVVDRNGQPVTDLRASEFTILEDGVPQRIEHFAAEQLQAAQSTVVESQPHRAASAFEPASVNRRTFLLLLGRGSLEEPSRGVDALMHLVRERLLPQDLVAVMVWNRATDFTTDHDAILGILERFAHNHVAIEHAWNVSAAKAYGQPVPAWIVRMMDDVFGPTGTLGVRTMDVRDLVRAGREARAQGVEEKGAEALSLLGDGKGAEMTGLGDDLGSLVLAVEYLRRVAGEKQLIFVSEHGATFERYEDDRGLARRAADARVALNVIHAGGVAYSTGNGRTQLNAAGNISANLFTARTARDLAKLTGGQFHAHEFSRSAEDIDRIDAATRFHYALGYYPLKDPVDGHYRRIQVRVSRPGVTVLARDGYFARADIGVGEVRQTLSFNRIATAAERMGTIPTIGITSITAGPAPQRGNSISVSMTLDLSRVSFRKEDGLNVGSLDLAIFAVTDRQKPAGEMWQTLDLRYTDERLAAIRAAGLRHTATVPLTGPAREVKIVVYDYPTDEVGSAVAKVERH